MSKYIKYFFFNLIYWTSKWRMKMRRVTFSQIYLLNLVKVIKENVLETCRYWRYGRFNQHGIFNITVFSQVLAPWRRFHGYLYMVLSVVPVSASLGPILSNNDYSSKVWDQMEISEFSSCALRPSSLPLHFLFWLEPVCSIKRIVHSKVR